MTVEHARQRLRAITLDQVGPPAWMRDLPTTTPAIAQMEREHADRIQAMRRNTDHVIEQQRAHKRELVAKSLRHKALLREEMIERRKERDRLELARHRDGRAFYSAIGAALSPHESQQLEDEIAEQNCNPNDPQVVRLRTWLEGEEAAAGLDVRCIVDPALRSGAAARTAGWIEVPPTQSLITAVIRAHEDGHMLHDPIPNERVVDVEHGKKIYPQSELAAWRWVLDHTPVWTIEMHAFMRRCLDTYRSCMNETEKAEADGLCAPLSFKRTKLRITTEGATR